MCDVATGVAARTGGRITVTLDSSIHFLRRGQGHVQSSWRTAVSSRRAARPALLTAEVFNDEGELLATAAVMVYYVDENAYADATMQK